MSNNNETNSFTSGPILSPFLKFTFPILISMFLQALYSAVDLIVSSRYCGPAESAAVSSGGKVVVTGLAMGVTVAIGRYIGEKDGESAAKSMGASSAYLLFLA